ncbi:MAG: hypothetical protein V1703_01275, partial [Candidatus Altiarchaeota archaeon]
NQKMSKRHILIAALLLMAVLSGCITDGNNVTTTRATEATTRPMETTLASQECVLSMCDCKCHPKGTTIEETTGRLCGINCLGEFNVVGCEYNNGACVEIKQAVQTTTTPTQATLNSAQSSSSSSSINSFIASSAISSAISSMASSQAG